MKFNLDWSELDRSVRRMGAQDKSGFTVETERDAFRVILDQIKQGLEIDISELEINQGGLLAYKDQLGNDHHVLLYIKDHGHYLQKALDHSGGGKKFHVADCSTLQRMKSENRFDRYVVTNNVTGLFDICGYDMQGRWHENVQVQLHVCRNCLKKLHYQNFPWKSEREKQAFVENFGFSEFFSTYSSYFSELPQFTAETAPGHYYTDDWKEISERYRAQQQWACESCRVDLEHHKHLLHTHHLNGIKSDNRQKNLRALCADCHSKQPGHDHMHVSHKARKRIQQLRHEQFSQTRLSNSWDDAFKYADPAVRDLLNICRHKGFGVPEIGYQAMNHGQIYAQLEIAWEWQRLGVVIEQDHGIQRLIDEGWRVLTVPQAIQQWA